MELIAVFDIGTSAVKGLLIKKDGSIYTEGAKTVQTFKGENGKMEQDPEEWWSGIREITDSWFERHAIPREAIQAVTFSGQMEDVILIRGNETTKRAILYSDMRAGEEAGWIRRHHPYLEDVTANTIAPSTPLAKLRWLAHHGEKAGTVVFSAKDYIIYKLTGSLVTDTVTGATTGAMDIHSKSWYPDILQKAGCPHFSLPELLAPEAVAGYVAGNSCGLPAGIPVMCGAGDAGASTMGAGALQEGDSYYYIGTTGWAAVPAAEPASSSTGVFTLAHLLPQHYISIAPLLNAGNVLDWAKQTYMPDAGYHAFDETINAARPGAGGLLFLPYLHGERFPVQDKKAAGLFYGIRPDTTASDFMRAVVEGLCYSLRHVADSLIGSGKGDITLIGGGTKSRAWCQVLADVTGQTVRVPENSEYLPAFGISATAFYQLGWSPDYHTFAADFLKKRNDAMYQPHLENCELYENGYAAYLKLYPAVETLSLI